MTYYPIEKYLPQKHPFILVDRILHADEKRCCVELTVKEETILLDDNYLTEGALVENIAQACASHIGYVEIHIRHNFNIRIGVVALLKNIEIKRLARLGETLVTEATETENFGDISIYSVQTTIGNEIIAKGETRVVLTDKLSKDGI